MSKIWKLQPFLTVTLHFQIIWFLNIYKQVLFWNYYYSPLVVRTTGLLVVAMNIFIAFKNPTSSSNIISTYETWKIFTHTIMVQSWKYLSWPIRYILIWSIPTVLHQLKQLMKQNQFSYSAYLNIYILGCWSTKKATNYESELLPPTEQ